MKINLNQQILKYKILLKNVGLSKKKCMSAPNKKSMSLKKQRLTAIASGTGCA